VNLAARKPVRWLWIFNLVFGVLVLPLLIGLRSTIQFWLAVGQLLLYLSPVILIVAIVLWGFDTARLLRAQRALWKGDYDLALRRLGRTKSAPVEEFRGSILCLAGRYSEAEQVFRNLTVPADPARQSRWLDLLADVLVAQNRWQEAKEALDQAVRLDAGTGGPYTSLADWYLLQGIEPQQALELIERANATPKFAALKPAAKNQVLAGRWATKGWAFAQLGRRGEAEAAISEALRLANPDCVPNSACVHLSAGRAFAAMEQPAKAREHFQQAAALDPYGRNGKLAATSR
jgi:tetratricopeptide (TPR) repeat protein